MTTLAAPVAAGGVFRPEEVAVGAPQVDTAPERRVVATYGEVQE